MGTSLEQERLPAVASEEIRRVAERFLRRNAPVGVGGGQALREEGAFDAADMRRTHEERFETMNAEQRGFVESALGDVRAGRQSSIFLEAPAGTGKTYCLNTLIAAVRGDGKIAVAVATSGIAAILLLGGRTFHSRFKAPLRLTPDTRFNVAREDDLAALLREVTLIVWDEAAMGHRHLLEGLDRTLQDIRGDDRPFGGVVVVVSGDFRQNLPVVPRGTPAQVISASLKRSPLWRQFRSVRLVTNMRLVGASPETLEFARFLEDLGDGTAGEEEFGPPDERGKRRCRFPSRLCLEGGIDGLIDFVFPGLGQGSPAVGDNVILATTNKVVDEINERVTARFPGGDEVHLLSSDALSGEDANLNNVPVEILNAETGAGLPPHDLKLEVGMPLMLLRNLDPAKGMCNGSRFILKRVVSRDLLECEMRDQRGGVSLVWVPRIKLTPKDDLHPYQWTRTQFPVRPAFAMTVSKSQGQTIRGRVGLYLPEPVFAHGQLYVAVSRTTDENNLRLCIPTGEHLAPGIEPSAPGTGKVVVNVVFDEVLRG